MPFFFQTAGTPQLVTGTGYLSSALLQSLTIKASTAPQETVIFLSGTTPILQPAGTIIQFGAKPLGEYDTTALTLTDFSAGAPAIAVPQVNFAYSATADYSDELLLAAMNLGDGNDANDLANLNLQAELRFIRPGDTNWTRSVNSVALNVVAPVLSDMDGTGAPAAGSAIYPALLAVARLYSGGFLLLAPLSCDFRYPRNSMYLAAI